MTTQPGLSAEILRLDAEAETERITAWIRNIAFHTFRRRGAVIGVSGGIDSSVVAFLCARALGSDRIQILFTPEADSSPDSLRLGRLVSEALCAKANVEDVSAILTGARCYERRDDAVRLVVPDYGPGYKCKIVLPGLLDAGRYSIFSVVVQAPDGQKQKVRLTPEAYLGIVAATNFKQRVRKLMEYYHADRMNYAVAGTPNRLEYDQGFFVKQGDGAADLKPIAHLYKSQVYALAEYLGVPDEIRRRPPTTDTFSLPQTQEEFYFALPYDKMDLCLYGHNHQVPATDVGKAIGLSADQVERVYRDIDQKRRTTRYLHSKPLLVQPVSEVSA